METFSRHWFKNGLALNRRQAITWTNADPIHWRIYAVLGGDESLQWRHNEHASVSNHQPNDYLLNGLFGRRSKVTSKLRVTGLCVGNSPGTGESPAQKASNAENVSIWWRHHGSLISAESVGQGWCKIATATKWCQFHATDNRGVLLRSLITDQYTLSQWHTTGKNMHKWNESHYLSNFDNLVWRTPSLTSLPAYPKQNCARVATQKYS